MRTREGRTLQSLRAVKAFLDTNASALGDVVNTGARRRLDDVIAALADQVATQVGSELAAQGATKKKYALRRVLLRRHMAAVARVAKADLALSPALEPLRMPKGKPTTERLAAAADGMAKAAEPFAEIFTAAGLPMDFIRQLTDAADALRGSVAKRSQMRGARGGATESIRRRLSEGRKLVAVLDVFVSTALEDDPALLANWNIVKRVQKLAAGPAVTPSTSPATHQGTAGDGGQSLAIARHSTLTVANV